MLGVDVNALPLLLRVTFAAFISQCKPLRYEKVIRGIDWLDETSGMHCA